MNVTNINNQHQTRGLKKISDVSGMINEHIISLSIERGCSRSTDLPKTLPHFIPDERQTSDCGYERQQLAEACVNIADTSVTE